MAGKIREWLSSKGVVGSRGRGRSYELGEAAPGIAGVANLVLKAMLMRGARMNCATHHGTIHAMNVRRPGFQGSLCLVGSITSHGWSCILWRRRHESQARKEGGGVWVQVERTGKPWEEGGQSNQGSGVSAEEAKIRPDVELRKG